MTIELTSWAPDLSPSMQGMPSSGIKNIVRRAAINFCRKTFLWRVDIDRISVVADTELYSLSLPVSVPDSEICSIESVRYKEDGDDDDKFRMIPPISVRQEDQSVGSGSWPFLTSEYPSYYWFDKNTSKLGLSPIPTEVSVEGLLIKVICVPTRTSSVLPDFLNNYYDAIVFGAKSFAFDQMDMPWANPQLASMHRDLFNTEVNGAKMELYTGNTLRPLSVMFRGGSWL